jgi:hypothetical protein
VVLSTFIYKIMNFTHIVEIALGVVFGHIIIDFLKTTYFHKWK